MFVLALTINQHGPHVGSKQTAELERALDPTKIPPESMPPFAEFLSRLNESAEAFAWLETNREAHFPGRPAVFVHFGDHHPSITNACTPTKDNAHDEGHEDLKDTLLRDRRQGILRSGQRG
ncbi:MAG: hypothetical protein U1F45_08925 [Burkholderiales bacterium]